MLYYIYIIDYYRHMFYRINIYHGYTMYIYPYLRWFYRCFQDAVHPPGVWHRAIEGVQGSNDAPWSGRDSLIDK
jgi:hypothetical protein